MGHRRIVRIVAASASLLLPVALGQTAHASQATVRVKAAQPGSTNAAQPATFHATDSDEDLDNPFDALYKSNFALKPLSADQIAPATQPLATKDLTGPAHIDAAYGTRTYLATHPPDGRGEPVRHDGSRRQAFNADNSRYITRDSGGAWYLYDAKTLQAIKKLDPLSGDCEPIWHASDPDRLLFTSDGGGTTWWTLNIKTGSTTVLFDFTGKTDWPEATSYWTGGEGTTSADGRFLSLMATRPGQEPNDGQNPRDGEVYGLVTLDLKEKKIVGTLDANDFPEPGAMPQGISTSASGKYAVPSWPKGQGGTRAYTRTFGKSAELTKGSGPADLAFGPGKQDYYVYADADRGKIMAVNLATRKRIALHTLEPADGETYSLHISGQAFDRPGWVVISTYDDSSDDGAVSPSPTVRPEYRKVWLLKLQPGGRALNVTHTHAGEPHPDGDTAEGPQASASRDLSRILFASDFGAGDVESFLVGLPTTFDR
ncbi:MAG: hypothetical protein Q3979_08995 [Actinomycetaceae bacterium]|nr:hypothetical protein [Actinomycetaceae bacterium]